jgi:hypothetical protein
LRARDEDDVEAFAGELEGVFFANAVGGAGYDCPGAFEAEFGNLISFMRKPEIKLGE